MKFSNLVAWGADPNSRTFVGLAEIRFIGTPSLYHPVGDYTGCGVTDLAVYVSSNSVIVYRELQGVALGQFAFGPVDPNDITAV